MITRRTLLANAAATAAGTLAAATVSTPGRSAAQTPKRGGTLSLRLWDPPHWDPYLILAFRTQIPYTFTHSRLLKHKAGPAIQPGTFAVEGDLAESWSQPDETTYVFKLRKGVRFHPRPPVNGRELTAEDVVYSVERFRTVKGNPQAYMLAAVDKVEALDRSTVKFTVKEPFAWFLDMIANPMTLPIIARECVEKFGDLKKAEATVGTGPWMLEGYRPNVGFTLVRHPGYFVPGLPSIDRIEVTIDDDNASRLAAFLAGKYDLGWEGAGTINRTDWNAVKDQLKRHRPTLRTAEYPSNVGYKVYMRTDKPPFSDVRVRRAVSHAINRQELIDAVADGVGRMNAAVPAALKEWALPVDQLGEGARYYTYDPAEARRLLAEAGHPRGFSTVMDFNNYGSTFMDDAIQLILKDLKAVGIDAKLNQKEYGAYIATSGHRQLRRHVLRGDHALPRSRQLPLHQLLPRPSAQRGQGQRPRAHRSPGAPAADPGPGRAPAALPRHPAPRGRPAVHHGDLLAGDDLRVGRRAQELRPQPGLRLRRPPHGGLARPLSLAARMMIMRLLALLLVALAGAAAPAAGAPDGHMTWGVHTTLVPTYFDPAETTIGTSYMVLYGLHDALVKPMPGKTMAPSLAESWTLSPDGLSYDFVLRKGARFHNGEPVTAEDGELLLRALPGDLRQDAQGARGRGGDARSGASEDSPQAAVARFHELLRDDRGERRLGRAEEVRREGGRRGLQESADRRGPYRFVSFTPGVELVLEACTSWPSSTGSPRASRSRASASSPDTHSRRRTKT